MNAKKIAIFGGVALVLFFLISQPMESANLVNNILNMLKDGAQALITFVKSLF
ncbi:MAG: hypothetical protein ACRDQ5_01750 [Sciscionella sp.]